MSETVSVLVADAGRKGKGKGRGGIRFSSFFLILSHLIFFSMVVRICFLFLFCLFSASHNIIFFFFAFRLAGQYESEQFKNFVTECESRMETNLI